MKTKFTNYDEGKHREGTFTGIIPYPAGMKHVRIPMLFSDLILKYYNFRELIIWYSQIQDH